MGQFQTWHAQVANPKQWKIKYYKGLGTSTTEEAKEYFSQFKKHKVTFTYTPPVDADSLDLVFNKKNADKRKEWI